MSVAVTVQPFFISLSKAELPAHMFWILIPKQKAPIALNSRRPMPTIKKNGRADKRVRSEF